MAGGAVGAAAAIVAAHLGYQARMRLPFSNVASGLLEDSLLLFVAYRYGSLRV